MDGGIKKMWTDEKPPDQSAEERFRTVVKQWQRWGGREERQGKGNSQLGYDGMELDGKRQAGGMTDRYIRASAPAARGNPADDLARPPVWLKPLAFISE